MAAPNRSLKAIYVANLDEIMNDMKTMDLKLQKEFRRELTKAVKPVEKLAESFIPSIAATNWRPIEPTYPPAWSWANDKVHRGRSYEGGSRWRWSQSEAVAGIQISRAKSKVQRIKGVTFGVTALSLVNKSVPGIIYELAGFGSTRSKNKTRRVSRNSDASTEFIRAIGKRNNYGEKRVIYRATYQMGKEVLDNIEKVLDKYLQGKFRR